jgi:hypothetical protein
MRTLLKGLKKAHGAERGKTNDEMLWLLGLQPTNYPEDENVVMESGASRAKQKLSDPKKYKIDTIRLCGNVRVREGDKVIQIMRTADSHYVEELAKVIEIRETQSRRGTAVAYLFLECRNRPKRIPWDKFKARLRGLRLETKAEHWHPPDHWTCPDSEDSGPCVQKAQVSGLARGSPKRVNCLSLVSL